MNLPRITLKFTISQSNTFQEFVIPVDFLLIGRDSECVSWTMISGFGRCIQICWIEYILRMLVAMFLCILSRGDAYLCIEVVNHPHHKAVSSGAMAGVVSAHRHQEVFEYTP